MPAYYNESDPYAAQWLRNLIDAGHIAPGDVDERSIVDVRPDDLRVYNQCHFFAGIGVWSYALRSAGWPDDRRVWTGSCPCQPFSAAGAGKGIADERHLWPHWQHLIRELGPDVILGEQVASKDGLGWLDLVQTDLEGTGYAFGAVDTCSAGSGAPHIRQRLRFAAQRLGDANNTRLEGFTRHGGGVEEPGRVGSQSCGSSSEASIPIGLANTDGGNTGAEREQSCGQHGQQPKDGGAVRLAYTEREQRQRGRPVETSNEQRQIERTKRFCNADEECGRPGPVNGFWRDADWLFGRDGKWRPVEPFAQPLAHGVANRVGKLRAYGNAVDAEATRHFIEAVMER